MTQINFITSGVVLTDDQICRIEKALASSKPRSAWDRGTKGFALNLLESYKGLRKYAEANDEPIPTFSLDTLLNGSDDWEAYCYSGCALICNADIAQALCTPSQLKRKDFGRLAPNRDENWMDVQCRAYRRAWNTLNKVVSQVLDTDRAYDDPVRGR